METIILPDKVRQIIDTLCTNGYEAYAVGGCVRDSLLLREPEDWDITTSAEPDEVKRLFPRTVDTGIAHGTVTVMMEREGFEVTTYRIDGSYKDSRHPEDVSFTKSLREDLKRRDFTINAMAYNEEEGLIDLFHGQEDLKSGILCCVGNAGTRFHEDALRILRAVRFSAQLGFEVEEETKEAMRETAGNLKKISAERIQTELVKLLVSKQPWRLRDAYELGITKEFLPEFDRMMETEQNHPHHRYSVGEHTLRTLSYVRPDKGMRLAMLFHDIGKPAKKTTDEDNIDHFYGHPQLGSEIAKDVLRRLKFDNATIDLVTRLVKWHDYMPEPKLTAVRRSMNKIGEDIFPLIFELNFADLMAQSKYKREEKIQKAEIIRQLYEEIKQANDCVSLKTLAVNGMDLIEADVPKGKEIGLVLKELLEIVLEDPKKNQKEYLLDYIRQAKKQG